MEDNHYARSLQLQEGWLCLDFANTVEWHASVQPTEHLGDYTGLVAWAKRRGLLSQAEAERLLHQAALRPQESAGVYARGVDLRETIYRIFSGLVHGERAQAEDLDKLNGFLCADATHFRIAQGSEGFVWDWQTTESTLDSMLWPVARSAAHLLTSPELERVGQCADDRGCGWLFLDTSRNRSRRWCSMEGCGNRAKVRQHYKRRQPQSADDGSGEQPSQAVSATDE